jgi:hypothetical protein
MSVLSEAENLVSGDRQDQYGDPREHFSSVAQMFQGVTGVELAAKEVVILMICLKLTRQYFKPSRDNLVDLAGYTKILAILEGEDDPGNLELLTEDSSRT